MNFLHDTSFVTASFYPASFYPSFAKAAAFQIPATQLSQSRTRMGVDCLNDRQVLQKGMPLTAIVCIIALIARYSRRSWNFRFCGAPHGWQYVSHSLF